ncbi:MAG TPA: N-acetyltransferase [Rudaea sp.]|nr:N-acetyltransferase [Rudaea sp.]
MQTMNAVVTNRQLLVRAATLADVDVIVALVESAYRGDSGRRGWTTESDILDGQRVDAESVAEVIVKAQSQVLLALQAATLIACAHIEKQDDACYFGMFAVNPDLQGNGTGKQMINEAERIARERYQCTRMKMTVISVRDDLIAWYERRGYHRTGVFKPFPYGDERFGIPKRDDLKFEVLEKSLS